MIAAKAQRQRDGIDLGSGDVVETFQYDAFLLNEPASRWGVPFLFTGRGYRSTFGFYEYRARAYHPGLGRFMSEDPKLFDAGDYNLFRYCHNDPVDRTDPMGLMTPWESGHLTPEQYARMMSDVTRDVLRNNSSAGGISIGMASLDVGVTVTAQGGRGSVSNRSNNPPAIEAAQFPAMKSATDKSAEAMHNDPEGYPYALGNGTLGQGPQPARGTRYVVRGYEVFTENAPYYGELKSVGHVHKPGTSQGFSDRDMNLRDDHGRPVPVMKNRDGYIDSHGRVQQYDLYHRGWRWFLRPDMSIEAGPMRY